MAIEKVLRANQAPKQVKAEIQVEVKEKAVLRPCGAAVKNKG